MYTLANSYLSLCNLSANANDFRGKACVEYLPTFAHEKANTDEIS